MGVKSILISQQAPQNGASSPYTELCQKSGVTIDFKPFFRVEPLTVREFRAQKIAFLDYTAIVFSSKLAIDAFFHICEETKITVPDTMKYFCTSESIAVYLQKYIVYRKRKIFFGENSLASIIPIATLPKHKGEKFLVTSTDTPKASVLQLFSDAKLDVAGVTLVKTVSNDLKELDWNKYQMVVFYSPADVRSLKENFPEFDQKDLLFATFGPATAKCLKEEGYKIEIEAPAPGAPSIVEALKIFLAKKK